MKGYDHCKNRKIYGAIWVRKTDKLTGHVRHLEMLVLLLEEKMEGIS